MNNEEVPVNEGTGSHFLLSFPLLAALQCNINGSVVAGILRELSLQVEGQEMWSLLQHAAFALLPVSPQWGMQFTLCSVHLLPSVEVLSQFDKCQDTFVTKVWAHLKEVCSPNENGTCLSCQHTITSPQPPSNHSALPPTFPRFTP